MRSYNIQKNCVLGTGAFASVYSCRKHFARKKYAAKVVDILDDNKLKWGTENEIEVSDIYVFMYI